ncbi:hypothetical protein GCM10009777_29230 [Microbacterium pumilum]|uniref:Alpha-amylase n=1 Tax=Microbacterium pumilum TaxID=344165 RepID=A0ABP5E768_9MICO
MSITEASPSDRRNVQGDAVLAVNAPIAGTVKGSDGQPLSGVIVSIWSSAWDGVTAWDYPLTFVASVVTSGTGTFTLSVPVGYYTLFFNPVDDPDSAWSWVGGQAVPGKYPTLVSSGGWQVNASLGASHAISGSVTGGPTSTPLSTPMTLWACNDRESSFWCSPNWEISSDPGGYGFWQLPAGYYLLEVSAPDSRYKGEWWNNKPDYGASDFIQVSNGVDTFADINLARHVQVLPELTVSGTAAVGRTVSVTVPTKVSGATYVYAWYSDGVAIAPSSPESTFLLTSAQAGTQITARVRVSKPGYATVTKLTAQTSRVIASSAPTITGRVAVGRALTANPNAWTPGTTFTYQWYADGVGIPGATSSTYMLTPAERDKTIKVGVKGWNPGYTTYFRGSGPTLKVAQAAKPTISGTPKVGQNLTAGTTGWTPGTTFVYHWYANGGAIAGAASSSLTVVSAYVGKTITVRVVGSKPGYTSFSQTSLPTAAVVR